MRISSNKLFHFTKDLDTLVKILEGCAFWPRYCCEYDWFNNKELALYVPMVCFTDIPITQAHDHMDFYGKYGIGLSKQWASKNNVCPVWYLKRKTLNILLSTTLSKKIGDAPEKFEFLSMCKHGIKGRCKNYQGLLKSKNFYEEREWRFVPQVSPSQKVIVGNTNGEYGNNEMTRQYLLHFKLSDIYYLFVETEADRNNLLSKLDEIFKEKTNGNELTLLKSRILSYEQLKSDF